ncbi:hypothetical protein SLEP1_g27107 [Rubroshorea leprosula]|uniref:Uncharacterized protein n=1 Tax=Rubroshorea leprosula TaxID=152421 RepID=A0AAV5JS62_9ROSI|nr:hypothetical protein SLEP1_g27107 [Rubroshorea leprosula]
MASLGLISAELGKSWSKIVMLECVKATTETLDISAMMAINKATVINKADKTMDEILQQYENIREIREALSSPTGAATNFDDDELEAALEELKQSNLEELPIMQATNTSCFSKEKQNQRRSCGFTGRDDSLIVTHYSCLSL